MSQAPSHPSSSRAGWSVLALVTLPFLLNDFANIFVRDYRLWLVIDYVFVKALPLGLILIWVRNRRLSYSDLGLRPLPLAEFMAWSLAMTLGGIFLDQYGSRAIASWLPATRLGGMPPIGNPWLNRVDLYLGLALVALVEEIIFRGLWFTVLSRWLPKKLAVLLISALAFGLIHWSLGLAAIAHTAVIGAVFMICRLRTGSVLPTIVAHFLVNYVAFSGLFFRT